jgi:hypothetical protein
VRRGSKLENRKWKFEKRKATPRWGRKAASTSGIGVGRHDARVEAKGDVEKRVPRAQAGVPVLLEIGVGGEAIVDAGRGLTDGGGGVAFGEPGGEFGAEAGLEVDERGKRFRRLRRLRR